MMQMLIDARRGQIFVQDIGASLAIAIITLLSLIAFMNAHFDAFKERVSSEHMQVVSERIASKLFVERAYSFNTGKYEVNSGFIGFLSKLNDEELYEMFRSDAALNREGISYDVHIITECANGISAEGGTRKNDMVRTTVLVSMQDSICTVIIGVGKR